MPPVDIRKGMPPRDLDRNTFEHRFLSRFRDPVFEPLQAELKAFAAAIKEKRPYPISADEVLHGVEVFEAIAKSARTGQPVVPG